MWRRCYRLGSLFFGFPLFVSLLPADEVPVNWIGPDSGNWSVASNWSPAVVPNNGGGNTYDVTIPFVPPFGENRFVLVDTSSTINSLSLNTTRLEISQTLNAGTLTTMPAQIDISGSAITLDPGATLNAGSVSLNGEDVLSVQGRATIGTLSLANCGGCPSFGVSRGALMNLGTLNGVGSSAGVGGTLNIASRLTISGNTFGLSIDGGTVTVGTGNLLPLNAPNTLVNAGAIVTNGTAGIGVGDSACTIDNFGITCYGLRVGSNGTYDEVIGGPTSFGTLNTFTSGPFGFSLPVSLAGTLEITLANSYIPPVGRTFTIINNSEQGITGTFSNIEGQTFNNGTERWDVDYVSQFGSANAVELVAVATPEPSLLVLAGIALLGIIWARHLPHSPALGARLPRSI